MIMFKGAFGLTRKVLMILSFILKSDQVCDIMWVILIAKPFESNSDYQGQSILYLE